MSSEKGAGFGRSYLDEDRLPTTVRIGNPGRSGTHHTVPVAYKVGVYRLSGRQRRRALVDREGTHISPRLASSHITGSRDREQRAKTVWREEAGSGGCSKRELRIDSSADQYL